MLERKLLVYCVQNGRKNKAKKKSMYDPLKEFDKNRPNKEVAIQFNHPGSTFAT